MKKMKLYYFLLVFTFGLSMYNCGDTKVIDSSDKKETLVTNHNDSNEFTKIDSTSKLNYFASHFFGAAARIGNVKLKDASVNIENKKLVSGVFNLDMSTIVITNMDDVKQKADFEGHMKSPDFFNIEKYPTSKFELTGVKESNTDGFNFELSGNLTILDSTRNIVFQANVVINENYVTIKSEKFEIDRTQWGLSYNQEGSKVPKDFVISNKIGFEVDVKIAK